MVKKKKPTAIYCAYDMILLYSYNYLIIDFHFDCKFAFKLKTNFTHYNLIVFQRSMYNFVFL